MLHIRSAIFPSSIRLPGFIAVSLGLHISLLWPWTFASPPFAGDAVTVLSVTLNADDATPAPTAQHLKSAPRPERQRTARQKTPVPAVTATLSPSSSAPAETTTATTEEAATSSEHKIMATDGAGTSQETARARLEAQFHAEFDRYFKNSYPRLALQKGWQGTLWLHLRVEPSGKLERIQVADSSGYSVLDQSAVETANKIGHLPDARRWLNGRSLDMRVPIVYRLLDR